MATHPIARGLFRFWLIGAVCWVGYAISQLPIDRDTLWITAPPVVAVHVQIPIPDEILGLPIRSDDQTVPDIISSVRNRYNSWWSDAYDKDQLWAARMSASRKAECHALDPKRFVFNPEDCQRLSEAETVPKTTMTRGLESDISEDVGRQMRMAHETGWSIVASALPTIVGPPLAVLAIGTSVLWASAGFRRRP